jgi:putative oxidoreductase
MDFLLPYRPQLLSLLRIMTGLLILQHGTGKYLNFPVGPMNNASPLTAGGAAGLFELLGGALLALGLYARLAAFVLSGTWRWRISTPTPHAASIQSSIRASWRPLYCFVLLYLAAAGGGPWSLDRVLRRDPV